MRTILFISAFIIIIPIVYGASLYKKLNKTMKLFLLTLGFNLLITFIALAFAYLFRNNLIVYNISQFFAMILLVLLFNSFDEIRLNKINVAFLIPTLTLIWTFFYSIGIDTIFTYSTVSSLISVLIILIFAFLYIIKLSSITKTIIYKSHIFWLLSGIICMHLLMSISDFLFLFISIYEQFNLNLISIINNVISVLCFTLAFYFYNKQYNENNLLLKSKG